MCIYLVSRQRSLGPTNYESCRNLGRKIFPQAKKKKSPLVYEKKDGENKESTLETLRSDGIMNPTSQCVPGGLGLQNDRCWCS